MRLMDKIKWYVYTRDNVIRQITQLLQRIKQLEGMNEGLRKTINKMASGSIDKVCSGLENVLTDINEFDNMVAEEEHQEIKELQRIYNLDWKGDSHD